VRPPFHRGPDAQAIAIDALAFLAGDAERLERFMALTGLSPETIRQAARSPHFMTAVLDHLAADESLLLAFAANQGLDPAHVLKARESLSRPDAMGLRDG
jgi:hypothetical protein